MDARREPEPDAETETRSLEHTPCSAQLVRSHYHYRYCQWHLRVLLAVSDPHVIKPIDSLNVRSSFQSVIHSGLDLLFFSLPNNQMLTL